MKKQPHTKTGVNFEKLASSTEVLRALAHPLRLRILKFIDSSKSVQVNIIYSALGLEQSITSQHLRILRTSGLVRTQRAGKYIHYAVDYEKVSETHRAVGTFLSVGPEIILEDDDEFEA